MLDGLIPQRYAMALYKYAADDKTRAKLYDTMSAVADAFVANPDLSKVLANPYVSRGDKRRLMLAAAGKDAAKEYEAFTDLVLNHKREMFTRGMALAYRSIYRKANNISTVRITTATALPDSETAKLKDLVANVYKNMTLEISTDVDAGLIGGFVIDVDNNRLDASVANEFAQLRQNLITN